MGTSAMLYVYEGGECRISALTSCDGYPSGVGIELLGFVSNRRNIDRLRESLPRCEFIPKEKIDRMREKSWRWEEEYIDNHPEYAYEGDSRLLNRIISQEGSITMRAWSGDRRMDDWAYVIDLDRMTFEIYKGWNDVPPREGERFYDGCGPDESGRYPFKEVAVLNLNDLPSNDEFLEICDDL